ncbi:MAG TPA: hypothetical protein V6D18_15850 [Thermosynechococcaceae cyanobacterium]
MTSKTLETNSIPIPPHLAGLLKQALGRTGTGFDEGAFLQQLHYWTNNSATAGWIVAGMKWIYNSLKSWKEQFPWMSEYGLRKAIANLKKLGLVETAQHWITSYRRVMFYRIDYERLKSFAGDLGDLITPRCATSDPVEVRTDRTSETDTSSSTSSEQQTGVVGTEEVTDGADAVALPEDKLHTGAVGNPQSSESIKPPGSGKNASSESAKFPELRAAVEQAIAQPLPPLLQSAIARFPEQVQPALRYLNHQQQRRTILNPVGYLYQAITQAWNIALPDPVTPVGFREWFDRTKEQGLVVAAMTIEGVHHTLHIQQGWVPTVQLMEMNLSPSA